MTTERTPLLIPAHNEANTLGRALGALPRDRVEPIVLAARSTDDTAGVAERFGVPVFRSEAAGKLPEIQAALRFLGDRALEPLLILDGDNRPLMPVRWHAGMMTHLRSGAEEQPVVVGGPAWFVRGGSIDDLVKNVRRLHRAVQGRAWESSMVPGQCGPNMGLHLKRRSVLDSILDLPHYWPGEDIALADAVVARGGVYRQPISPGLMTVNPASESYLPFLERLRLGPEESRRRIVANYVKRGAMGSVPYPGVDRRNIPDGLR